jgi:hypothetical protein
MTLYQFELPRYLSLGIPSRPESGPDPSSLILEPNVSTNKRAMYSMARQPVGVKGEKKRQLSSRTEPGNDGNFDHIFMESLEI